MRTEKSSHVLVWKPKWTPHTHTHTHTLSCCVEIQKYSSKSISVFEWHFDSHSSKSVPLQRRQDKHQILSTGYAGISEIRLYFWCYFTCTTLESPVTHSRAPKFLAAKNMIWCPIRFRFRVFMVSSPTV